MRRLGNPSPLPHITVVEPPRLSSDLSWWNSVTDVGARSEPVSIALQGIQTFDDRVLFLGVDAPELTDLRRRLLEVTGPSAPDQAALSDSQPFVPHLTLLMARRGRKLPDQEKIEPILNHFDTFRADELTLFRRDIPSHAYRAWRRVPLGAS
jgi:2'-5' RNA ligase